MTIPEAVAIAGMRNFDLWKLCRRNDKGDYDETPDHLREQALDVLASAWTEREALAVLKDRVATDERIPQTVTLQWVLECEPVRVSLWLHDLVVDLDAALARAERVERERDAKVAILRELVAKRRVWVDQCDMVNDRVRLVYEDPHTTEALERAERKWAKLKKEFAQSTESPEDAQDWACKKMDALDAEQGWKG